MERRAFLKSLGKGAAAVAGGALGLTILTEGPAQANVSVHSQCTVKGFFPLYRAVCPCPWHGKWHEDKNRAWNDVDAHKLAHGVRP